MHMLCRTLPILATAVTLGVALRFATHDGPLTLAGLLVWVVLPFAHLFQQAPLRGEPAGRAALQILTCLLVGGFGLAAYLTLLVPTATVPLSATLVLLLVPLGQWLLVGLASLAQIWLWGASREIESGRLGLGL